MVFADMLGPRGNLDAVSRDNWPDVMDKDASGWFPHYEGQGIIFPNNTTIIDALTLLARAVSIESLDISNMHYDQNQSPVEIIVPLSALQTDTSGKRSVYQIYFKSFYSSEACFAVTLAPKMGA